MPPTKRFCSRTRLLLKARPKRGARVRYSDRVSEVLGGGAGRTRHDPFAARRWGRAKQCNEVDKLRLLDEQLF